MGQSAMSEQTAVVDPEGEADHIGIRQNSGACKQRPETPAAFCSGHGLCQRYCSEGVSERRSHSNYGVLFGAVMPPVLNVGQPLLWPNNLRRRLNRWA